MKYLTWVWWRKRWWWPKRWQRHSLYTAPRSRGTAVPRTAPCPRWWSGIGSSPEPQTSPIPRPVPHSVAAVERIRFWNFELSYTLKRFLYILSITRWVKMREDALKATGPELPLSLTSISMGSGVSSELVCVFVWSALESSSSIRTVYGINSEVPRIILKNWGSQTIFPNREFDNTFPDND